MANRIQDETSYGWGGADGGLRRSTHAPASPATTVVGAASPQRDLREALKFHEAHLGRDRVLPIYIIRETMESMADDCAVSLLSMRLQK